LIFENLEEPTSPSLWRGKPAFGKPSAVGMPSTFAKASAGQVGETSLTDGGLAAFRRLWRVFEAMPLSKTTLSIG
jgi:hypothetical protein